ncbi:unnamed protein product [Cyprideis torosa]|uniref:Uncharacterized protein n=1 Tax=Cyprideis torosa TaxID=163714 RepID=A0A7R8ZQV4_9CRUS|nr:unnamed protein product [Cyprideis torosa]CAG0892859.1 unnamed protein product [Cyprideis torosa]
MSSRYKSVGGEYGHTRVETIPKIHHLNNLVLFPVDNLLKCELKGQKGDLRRPFDRAAREYEAKFNKLEKVEVLSSEAEGRLIVCGPMMKVVPSW